MRTEYWVLGITAVVIIVFAAGWGEVLGILSRVDGTRLLMLCILQTATLAVSAYQWQYLLRKLHRKIPFSRAFALYLAGSFVESVTPSVKLGGEAARVYLFRRETSLSYQEVYGVLLAYKYFSLLPFLLICTAIIGTAAFRYPLPAVAYGSLILLFLVFAITYRLIKGPAKGGSFMEGPGGNPRLLDRAARFVSQASGHARKLTRREDMAYLVSLSFLVWAIYPVKVFLVARILFIDVEFLTAAVATYTAYLVSMLPLLPGGLGSFEGTMALVLAAGTIPLGEGMAMALLSRSITFWYPLILSAGSVLFLALQGKNCLPGFGTCKPDNSRSP